MNAWNRIRPGLIFILALATLGSAGRMLLSSTPLDRELPAVAFPQEPAVPGWHLLKQESPPYRAPDTTRYEQPHGPFAIDLELQFIPDLPVQYVGNPMLQERYLHRGELPLDAGMHFTVNSRGRIIPNMKNEAPALLGVEPRDDGSAFWTGGDRLHLSTVMTAAGDRAMRRTLVARSMYLDHLSLGQVGRWLCGSGVFPDRRCVLIHFSLPAGAATPEEGRRLLVAALAEWSLAHPIVFPPATDAP